MLDPLARPSGQFGEEVLGVQDAEDVVAVAAVDGDPRVPGVDDLLEHLVPGERGGDGDHVGPRGHDLGDVGVAQFDHAFDHLAGVFLQQALAMPFGDDGADVFFERFFVGDGGLAARQAVQGHVDDAAPERQRRQQEARAPEQRPGEKEEGIGPQPGEGPGQPEIGRQHQQQAGQQARRPSADGETERLAMLPQREAAGCRRRGQGEGPQRLHGQAHLLPPMQDVAQAVGLVRLAADLLQFRWRELGQRGRSSRPGR